LFLGEANLDEFYIDQFIIGKFNPQTEILADLSSRLTVAEAGLTNTANEFTTYTQNAVLTNASAVVAVGRNQTTNYDTVAITDTRGGFTVKDGQDFYLVNVDGTFQAVKIRDDQTVTDVTTPTTYTLKIQSITFSTTIAVGAMLYESAWTQSTRISQSAGQIVLKAIESVPGQGYVDSVALVQLTASVGSGSSVKIKGDLIELNNIQIIRDTGSGLIQTQNFVAGSTGWRIRGEGDAEFNNVTVRGSVFVTGGDAATETFANTAASTAESNAKAALNVTIRANSAPATRPDTTAIRAGDVWINTASGQGNLPHTYDGTTPYNVNGWIRMYTVIDGGNITTGTIRADLVTIQTANSSPALTLNTNGISMVQQSYLTNLGSGLKWYTATTLKGVIYNDESEGDNTLNYFVTDSAGRHLFGAGTSDPDERFEINASFVRTGFGQGLRVFGELRVYDVDFSNYANIAYADATANRTYTIPFVAASNFVMSEGNQTINGNKTFGEGVTVPSLILGPDANKATIQYTANIARVYTVPNAGANANFIMSEGIQLINGAKTFGSVVVIPDATAATHAVNRQFADARYVRANQANTYTGIQTFGLGNLALRNTENTNSGTLNYGNASVNRTYTFSGASGTVLTTGNQTTVSYWTTVGADQNAFVASGRIQITDGTDTIWIPFMN
jgi:hypothetical protein